MDAADAGAGRIWPMLDAEVAHRVEDGLLGAGRQREGSRVELGAYAALR